MSTLKNFVAKGHPYKYTDAYKGLKMATFVHSEYFSVFCVYFVVFTLCSELNVKNCNSEKDVSDFHQTLSAGKNIVCYYQMTRHSTSKPIPDNLNATLCTHVIYFGVGTDQNLTPGPFTADQVKFITTSMPLMKKLNPSLKIILCHRYDFAPILLSNETRIRFVSNSVELLRKYRFDGLDLDWEFPREDQKKNYSIILKNFNAAYNEDSRKSGKPRLLLSAAVPCASSVSTTYDIPTMGKYLDFVNLMGYDFHSFHPPLSPTGYNSPLFPSKHDQHVTLNVNWSGYNWVNAGVPKAKLMIGVPTYPHAFKLKFEWLHGLGDPSVGRGNADSSRYPLVCEAFEKYNASRVWDDSCKVPYAYYGDQWISYDDEQSLTFKTKWAMNNGFAGVMVFSFNSDDYMGHCKGKVKFPLMSAIYNAMFG